MSANHRASATPETQLSPAEAYREILQDVACQIEYMMHMGILGIELKKDKPEKPADITRTLEQVRLDLGDCTRCGLSRGRTNIVFGEGNPQSRVVLVGEAPGGEEDKQGRPFVGKAGELLTKIIENGMDIPRKDVYICNVIKCRPPDNRDPQPEEVAACEPFLLAQLEAIRPDVIIALGRFAAQSLLGTTTAISKLRGGFKDYHGIPLMPTYHPAYLLRNPSGKGAVWEDIKQVIALLKNKQRKRD